MKEKKKYPIKSVAKPWFFIIITFCFGEGGEGLNPDLILPPQPLDSPCPIPYISKSKAVNLLTNYSMSRLLITLP